MHWPWCLNHLNRLLTSRDKCAWSCFSIVRKLQGITTVRLFKKSFFLVWDLKFLIVCVSQKCLFCFYFVCLFVFSCTDRFCVGAIHFFPVAPPVMLQSILKLYLGGKRDCICFRCFSGFIGKKIIPSSVMYWCLSKGCIFSFWCLLFTLFGFLLSFTSCNIIFFTIFLHYGIQL